MPYLYLTSLFPAVLVIYGNLHGGQWTVANAILVFIILVFAEFFKISDYSSNPRKEKSFVPNLVIILHPVAHTLGVLSLLYGIYSGTLQGMWMYFAIFSTGINSGLSGIISAHELIHRREKWAKALGIWNLWLVNYIHYYIEHVNIHHRYVGTAKDAATAHKNESLYRFWIRTIPSQWKSAFGAQKKFVLSATAFEIFTNILVFLFAGPVIWGAFFANSMIAVLLLEYANYVEHYGLVRKEGEPIRAHHSWQSDSIFTRTILMELSRHSDHHLRASKPYQKLDSVPGTPEAPFGYFGMFFVAAVPWVWFKMMNPIIEERRWEKSAT